MKTTAIAAALLFSLSACSGERASPPEELDDRARFTFSTARYSAGSSPTRLAIADFNADGELDIATSGDDLALSVFFGRGLGLFGLPRKLTVGLLPDVLEAGYFTGDGRAGIVLCGMYRSCRTVQGNVDGSFEILPEFTQWSGWDPTPLVADFDGNGSDDVAFMGGGSTGATVYLTRGPSLGLEPVSSPTETYTGRTVGADLNGDGKIDVVSADPLMPRVSVMLGGGDGSLHEQAPAALHAIADFLVSGDFNGDGRSDLIALTYFPSGLSVLLGRGDGSFESHRYLPLSLKSNSLEAGDFDGDGKLDLAMFDSSLSYRLYILPGLGDGTFSESSRLFLDGGVDLMKAVDINKDGKMDLVVVQRSRDTVVVLLNNTP
jgi:hypothetical protein